MDNAILNKSIYNYEDNSSLIPLAKAGDEEAMNILIEINMPLVSSLTLVI